MGVLAGPYLAATALLVLSGVLKMRRPAPTARALARFGFGPLARLAPVLGVAETVVGLGALMVEGRLFPALATAFYLAFSAFVALALTGDEPASDCGCFGADETPPTPLHLALNVAAAAVCGVVAVRSGGTLGGALDGQPLFGIPFLLLTGICVALAYCALTVLPRTRVVTRS